VSEPTFHLAALSLGQLRAAIRALADTAEVRPQELLDEENLPPSHLTLSEWSAILVLREAYLRGCEEEGVSPLDGWIPDGATV
jgi:hypothetical protein